MSTCAHSRSHSRSHCCCWLIWRLSTSSRSLLLSSCRCSAMLMLISRATLLFSHVLVMGRTPLCLASPLQALRRRRSLCSPVSTYNKIVPTWGRPHRCLTIKCYTVAAAALLLMLLQLSAMRGGATASTRILSIYDNHGISHILPLID